MLELFNNSSSFGDVSVEKVHLHAFTFWGISFMWHALFEKSIFHIILLISQKPGNTSQ